MTTLCDLCVEKTYIHIFSSNLSSCDKETCDTFRDNYTSVDQEEDTEDGKLILICAELQYICFSI